MSEHVTSDQVPVPNVLLRTLAEARNAIQTAGLVVGTEGKQIEPTVAPGIIISQEPAPGIAVPRGTAVNLIVSAVAGKPLKDLILAFQQDVQGSAEEIMRRQVSPDANVLWGMNNVIIDTKTALALEGDQLVAFPVGLDLKPESAAVSSLQLRFTPLPREPAPVPAPEVVFASLAEASTALQNAGLRVGTIVEQEEATVGPGIVMGQNPAPGTVVQAGSPVDLVISQATSAVTAQRALPRTPTVVDVHDLLGLSLRTSLDIILALGLRIGRVTEESSTAPVGSILRQTPAAGTAVVPGTAIDLAVARPTQT